MDAQGKDVYEMPLKDMSIETEVSLHQGEDTGVIKQYAAEVVNENQRQENENNT